eukprot:305504-Heterocapsa_arctica.AAC.1
MSQSSDRRMLTRRFPARNNLGASTTDTPHQRAMDQMQEMGSELCGIGGPGPAEALGRHRHRRGQE